MGLCAWQESPPLTEPPPGRGQHQLLQAYRSLGKDKDSDDGLRM